MNFLEKLLDVTGSDRMLLLEQVAQAALDFGVPAYLVGGPVRDLLLSIGSDDIDIMLEGEAPQFVKGLEERWEKYFPGRPRPEKTIAYKKYHTAKILFAKPVVSGIIRLDFSSARKEEYPCPGAPPRVNPGTLAEDLARRDFSINAMALCLTGERKGELCDFHSGEVQLQQRLLCVLHEQSFQDDPARLIRGVRFAVRFGFDFDQQTKSLFKRAVQGRSLTTLPPARLFDEFRKALCESQPMGVLDRLQEEDLLAQIHPLLVVDEEVRSFFLNAAFSEACPVYPQWCRAAAALSAKASDRQFEEMLDFFSIEKRLRTGLIEARKEQQRKHAP